MLEDVNTFIILETNSNSNYKVVISKNNKKIITLQDIILIIKKLLSEEDLSKNQKKDLLVKTNKFKQKL